MANNRGSSRIGGQLAAHLGNLLDLIKVVQGPGSGIDADTVDNIQGSSIVRNDLACTQRVSSIAFGHDNELWTTSASKQLWLNYRSYDESTTMGGMITSIGDGKGVAIFNANGATKAITTTNNTLDDGAGNSTFSGMMTITGHGVVSGGAGDTNVSLNIQNAVNGTSSIVFSSGCNKTTDKGIIKYFDSAGDDESITGSGENSMLLIACENDGNQDRVRIRGAWVDIVGKTADGSNSFIARFKNSSYVDKMTVDQNGSIITSGSLTVTGGAAIGGDLTTSANINLGKVLMVGTQSYAKSSISFYSSAYDTWQEYMSNSGSGNAINGTLAPAFGSVTQWARRSLIENVAGYGWIWESAKDKTMNGGTSSNPTPMMALDSTNGNLSVRGSIQVSSKYTIQYNSSEDSLDFIYG